MTNKNVKQIYILGSRGVPSAHGGFETFAEQLSLYLCSNGWSVWVYCQKDGCGPIERDCWRGINRIHIPAKFFGALGTMYFDLKSIMHMIGNTCNSSLVLTLGYNTALFNLLFRLKGIRNIINMDGIEWRRRKWNTLGKAWFRINEFAACQLANHLIADHPEIKKHLSRFAASDKITMIPYCAERVLEAEVSVLARYGLIKNKYAVVIARPEPENSIYEIVCAWSQQPRFAKLVVLGCFDKSNAYHHRILKAASSEVLFPGAIYDIHVVQSLRYFASFYIHGHQVGGTNPSLVESLGAGNPVIAHDNPFNRWVLKDGGLFFHDEMTCARQIEYLLKNECMLKKMSVTSIKRHNECFTINRVLDAYEELLLKWYNYQ